MTTSHVFIPGIAGDIEAILNLVPSATAGAVLCHPHPLYGGTMHDMVLAAIEAGFASAGISTLRFNFRGVGESSGPHDRGVGEVDDVSVVAAWFRETHLLADCLLGGYSFGAGIAMRAAATLTPPALVLVAPPLQMLGNVPRGKTLVVLGEEDNIVDCRRASALFAAHAHVTVHPIAGEDHFFGNAFNEISQLVRAFVKGKVAR